MPMKKAGGRKRPPAAGAGAGSGHLGDAAPYPFIQVLSDGTVVRANQAAVIRFPGIRAGDIAHPVVAGIMAAAAGMTRGTRFVDREDAHGDRIYSQRIVREAGRFDVYMTDVTDGRLAREELRLLETHDRLTTLLSRGHLLDRLTEAVHSALRYKFPLSLALCDVDGMHRINDEFGHRVGDEVLAGVGRVLKAALRAQDIAGRYGGDEFVVVFPHTTAYDAVIGIDRIRQRLEKLEIRTKPAHAIKVTLSFGIADLSPKDMHERDLLEAAQRSLAEAKAGR
jgi:diguanylate cyclase (GGDEF)-like protein